MHSPRGRSILTALALLSSSLLVIAGASQASSSPPAPPAAPPTATAAGEPLGEDAVAIAREHLRAERSELGLAGSDVDELGVSSVVPSDHNGLTHVYFQQRVNSLDVANSMVNVAVRADGTVFRVANNAVGSAAKLANDANPGISDVQAAQRAAAALELTPTESFASDDVAAGADRARELGDGGISREAIPVKLVYHATKGGALRLAWQLGIYELDGEHYWQIRIDADTGKELGADDLVADDGYDVYPFPVEAPSFAAPAPPADGRTDVTNPAILAASPFGWHDTNGVAGAEFTTTQGNNVHAYTDVDDNDLPDAGSSPDGGAGLDFDFALDLTQAPSTYRPAAVTNLFYANNRTHDILYRYGFDEAAGSFQENNYGNGGVGGDSVNAEAQDGGGINNANFFTPADGQNPRMQMYVWNLSTPDRDGDFDNGIIVHEYGHGVSNRLTGGPASVGCLQNQEQGGEGWSDYLAYMLTMPNGTEPAGGRGIGTYALNQPTTGPGIREYRYSTSMAINLHTYDSIKTVAVPHGVGSVWAEMLWELTYALIDEHGFSANLDDNSVGGNKISLQLVMDGMKLQPCNPGFVDARDAILDADQANNAGENECLIWTAFAKRGLGFSATQGLSTSRSDGAEAFDMPPVCLGLDVTRTATPATVQAGDEITYGFHVENVSDDAGGLTGVEVTGTVGDHAAFQPGSATCGGTFDSGTGVVTFPIGAMALGATLDCEFAVDIDPTPYSEIVFSDDIEPDLSAWTASHGAGTIDWGLSTADSHSPTHSAFAANPAAVSDQYLTLNDPVVVGTNSRLTFWHKRDIEAGFDGGVVEVSTNGGTTWADVGEANFVENGYTHTNSTCCSTPIPGRRAFSGVSDWVRSQVDLSGLAGESVKVRFRLGTDNVIGTTTGWFVDDVEIGDVVETTSEGTAEADTVSSYDLPDATTRIVEPTGATVPAAPSVTGSTPSAGAVSVAFTPGADGGSAITGYTAECVSTNGGVTNTASGATSPISVSGLSAGKSYHCRVLATNAVGDGPYSGFGSTVLVPAVVPGAPTVTGSTPSAGAVSVAFTPGSDGGSAITGYTAECVSTDGGVTNTETGATSPISVSGLSAGKSYHCRVLATNAVGDGPYSGFGSTVLVPAGATVPAAPSVTGSTPSAGAVSVAFTPGANGGSAITGYTAQCVSTDGGVTNTASGASSPISVSGLSAGKSYHCRVLATNAVGSGPYSGFGPTVTLPAPPPVATAPGKPVITSSVPVSKKKAKIFFTLASDGGSPVTSYKAVCKSTNGGKKRSATRAASPIKVKKLTPGKKYRCKVRATNAVGTGPWSKKGKKFTMPSPRVAVVPRLSGLDW